MPLPIVPPAASDEWLGFWLARIAYQYRMPLHSFLARLDLHPPRPASLNWSHTVQWTETQWHRAATNVRVDPDSLRAMQTLSAPIARGSSCGYCPECVLDAKAGAPFWRRAWMDATSTWCSSHQVALVPIASISRVAIRTLANAQHDLHLLALTRPDPAQLWLEQLAHDAAELTRLLPIRCGNLPTAHSATTPAADADTLLNALLDQLIVRILDATSEYDDAKLLAKHLGAPGVEALELFGLPRKATRLRTPMLGQVRKVGQRSWLIGAAATIIAPTASSNEFLERSGALRETLRTWLWARTDAWNLIKLIPIVRAVTAAGMMVP